MNRLTLVATSFLLFMALTIQAQEAHRKYSTIVSQIEKQPDSRSKSEERGKALATFYDSRIIEAGSETAKIETATIFRQFIDYDFLAAFNFLMKIKKQDDALLFTKGYMSAQERTMIRTVASHTVSNANTTASSSYPENIPKPGNGLKGKWNSGNLIANTTNANNDTVVQTQTSNGEADLQKGVALYQAKNYTEAFTWLKKASDKGQPKAMLGLAAMYIAGIGVTESKAEAFNWYKKAAEKEEASAMYMLGSMYLEGIGTTQNKTEAKNWLQKSADKGDEKAKIALQKLQSQSAGKTEFEYGSQLEKAGKINEAIDYYTMAKHKGSEEAKTALQRLQQSPSLTAFKGANGKWGFKDDKNIIIVQPKYDETSPFSEGMAAVCITEDNTKKWGYIDKNGKEIVPLIYGDAIRFSEGLAAVRPVGKTWNSFYGFIDKSGKLVIPHQYEFVFDNAMYDGWVFTNGKAKVYKDKRIFYIDKTGEELKDGAIAVQAQELKAFSDKPLNRFGKWGFKDQNGKVIVEPKYDHHNNFSEGLAWVSAGGSYDEEFDMILGGKYGFIDNTGKEVIALKYESALPFSEGLAAVKLNGKWGYINKTGKVIIPFQYSEAFIFMKGKAKVKKDGKEFFIDKTGKEVK